MSHLGSITRHEPTVDLAAVAVVKGHGATALLASAMGPALKSAGDTSLPVGVRSLAALVAGTHLTGIDPTGARLDGASRAQVGLVSACQQAASSGHAMPTGARFDGTCLSSSGRAGR